MPGRATRPARRDDCDRGGAPRSGAARPARAADSRARWSRSTPTRRSPAALPCAGAPRSTSSRWCPPAATPRTSTWCSLHPRQPGCRDAEGSVELRGHVASAGLAEEKAQQRRGLEIDRAQGRSCRRASRISVEESGRVFDFSRGGPAARALRAERGFPSLGEGGQVLGQARWPLRLASRRAGLGDNLVPLGHQDGVAPLDQADVLAEPGLEDLSQGLLRLSAPDAAGAVPGL